MTQKRYPSRRSDDTQYRMRPRLQRLQIAFSIVLILFSLFMILILFRRQEQSYLEYLLWVGSIGVWCYAIWYAVSARLIFTAEYIEYRAGFIKLQIEWHHLEKIVYEASGPVIYVQDSDQNQPPHKQIGKKNRQKKIPLYLFMADWKTKEDWKNDLVGKEILARASWLFKT